MLTTEEARAYLKADPADDAVVAGFLTALQATFRVESKRRWPAEGEPALTVVVDPAADPLEYRFIGWVDSAVLSPDEVPIAEQWVKFTLGHWYENRQSVAVGLNVMEVPDTANKLMKLLRSPTL
jgi:hypothetical protein